MKRSLNCSYPPNPSELDSCQDSPARDGSESDTRVSGANQAMPTRMLEMRLMHQYLTSTYHSLSQDGLSAYHLSIIIPQMATSFPYLLDSILALSALHLAFLEPDHRLSWLDAAVRYQSQAGSGMGKILPNITPQHYEPAFVSSVFIMLFATGFSGISRDGRLVDPVAAMLEVRTLIAGCAMLSNRFNETGIKGELDGWLCVPETEENLDQRQQSK